MAISEAWLETYVPVRGGVAVDVGANHGEWTRELARRFETVYAVEPNPALGEELLAIGENVEVLPVGAWCAPEWYEFTTYGQDVHLSAFFAHGGINTGEPTGSVRIWCQPIDEMPIAGRVDFIKIDVEGAESEVVLGAMTTIQHDRPRLIIEAHTYIKGLLIAQILKMWGYAVEAVRHPAYTEVPNDVTLWDEHYWLVCNPD